MTTEPDILEALTELAEAKVGGPMPKCMDDKGQSWGTALSEIARRAKEEIGRNRAILARCMGGRDVCIDLGNGVLRSLYQDPLPASIDPAGVLKEDGT